MGIASGGRGRGWLVLVGLMAASSGIRCGGTVDLAIHGPGPVHTNDPGSEAIDSGAALEPGFDATSGAPTAADGGGDLAKTSAEGGGSSEAGQAAPPDPASAPSFLENPAHTGYIDDPSLTPPLAPLWTEGLGGTASYPLIVNGTIYVLVTSSSSSSGATDLVALDATTGTKRWTVDSGGAFAHAYDAGRIFTVTAGGLLASFDAASGAPGWSATLPGQYSFSSAPTAYRGIVYVGGAGEGGTVYATDESNGNLLWTQEVANGDDSAPTVADEGVFVSYACVQAYAFDRASGSPLWHYSGSCEGGGGATTVLSGGIVYARDFMGNIALDAATGAVAGAFNADPPPAFDATHGYFLAGGTLRAEVATTRAVLWSFAGDGALASAPLVVGGEVYVGSSQGGLFGLDATTGTLDWSTTVGGALGFSESGGTYGAAPFAAAGGLLVVPVGTKIIAYAHTQNADSGALPVSDAASGD
jgi:outer membrane protein assembly factor BamB